MDRKEYNLTISRFSRAFLKLGVLSYAIESNLYYSLWGYWCDEYVEDDE